MSGLDLDAIDAAGAALTCCRSRCSICGRKSWCGGHAMGDSACTRPGAVECRAVATVRRLRTDLAAARAEGWRFVVGQRERAPRREGGWTVSGPDTIERVARDAIGLAEHLDSTVPRGPGGACLAGPNAAKVADLRFRLDALLADEALTVGQALADERFQDTTHVAEGGPDGRIQWRARGDENGADVLVRQWRPAAKRWRPWSMLSVNADQFAWPARLVPLADADAPPESRGPL